MRIDLSVVLTILILSSTIFAKQKPVPELQTVTTIFVSGTNEAADELRDRLRDNKTCLQLATKADDAEATLEVKAEGLSNGGEYNRILGSGTWVVSGTVTLKSGDQVWSKSERYSDTPFGHSGAKAAAKLLLGDLSKAAGCKLRQKIESHH